MWSGYYNFLHAYESSFTYSTTRSYTQTRNWQIVAPIAPKSVGTIQFWLSMLQIRYIWQAVLKAKGSFELSTLGMQIGHQNSLTQLSQTEDLFFYMFGQYIYPDQPEVIVSVDDRESQRYPYSLPSFE